MNLNKRVIFDVKCQDSVSLRMVIDLQIPILIFSILKKWFVKPFCRAKTNSNSNCLLGK